LLREREREKKQSSKAKNLLFLKTDLSRAVAYLGSLNNKWIIKAARREEERELRELR